MLGNDTIRRSVLHDGSILRQLLRWRWLLRRRIFDNVHDSVEDVWLDRNCALSDFRHGVLGRVLELLHRPAILGFLL